MTAVQVRRHASSYGFRLLVENGELKARGNSEAMTEELKNLIASHKADVIASIKADEKAEKANAVETTRWFLSFQASNVGGVRLFKGEVVNVWDECKRLSEGLDKIGQMPRVTSAEEQAFQENQKRWINDVRWFREAFEEGEIA